MSADSPALLVVDDSDENRYTLVRRLEREGYSDVVTAAGGAQALDLLAARAFDLVLLDLVMPEMNGYEVLERMKADPSLADVPVVMVSALDEINSVIRCIELGAEDYLTKPVNPALLRARIGNSLARTQFSNREAAFRRELEGERRRSEDLLHAFLPAAAVREFSATGAVQPRRFAAVAVLGCEVVGFGEYCDRHSPAQAIAELRTLTERLEETARAHRLENIRLVGTVLRATGGLQEPAPDPVLRTAQCGLAMVAAGARTSPGWELRVGLHVGPVVAGVLNRGRPVFDLWGDTVDTAVRLAGQAAVGRVSVTAAAWRQVRDRCRGEARGMVQLGSGREVELIECLEAS